MIRLLFAIIVVRSIASALFWLIFIRVILSWLRPAGYNRTFSDIERFVYGLTEPILRPIRRLLPETGGIDFSPFVAIILIQILERFILGALGRI